MAEAVIELGDTWSTPPAEQPERRDGRPDPRVWLLLLALVPVLAMGGSGRPAPAFREAASVAAAGTQVFAITGGEIDVVEASSMDSATVASYPLAGGARRWSATIPGPVNYLVPEAGVLLVVNVSAAGPGRPLPSVTALDQATGRMLWSRPGARLVDVPPGRGRAVMSFGRDPVATGVLAVDLRTGGPGGSVRLSGRPGAAWAVVGGPDLDSRVAGRLLTLVDDTLALVDEDSGEVVATAQVGIPSTDARRDARAPRLYVMGTQGI